MNNREEKLKKILFNVIDKLTENTDVYHHNGSMWLIHTDDRKWIFEFTKRKTLWYNHEFFRTAFKFVSLEVTHNRYFITEWFESRFLNKPKFVKEVNQDRVKRAATLGSEQAWRIENTIQNGVKDTLFGVDPDEGRVEDAIQNGVKDTEDLRVQNLNRIEDTIQNGVKSTQPILLRWKANVEEIIENGVKDACYTVDPTGNIVEVDIQDDAIIHTGVGFIPDDHIEDAIQNGIKHPIKN